jgi:hypothetical protein
MELPVGGERHPVMDERIVTGTDRGTHFILLKGQEQLTILNRAGEQKSLPKVVPQYFLKRWRNLLRLVNISTNCRRRTITDAGVITIIINVTE